MAAAAAGPATMNNIQNQWDHKPNLMKEFCKKLGGSSLGRAAAKAQLENSKIMKAVHAGAAAANDPDEDESSIEPDSQESLLESILECEECIANLDSIHVQQKKLQDSTFLDASSVFGKR
jgi:hypothetical protein